MLIEFNSFLDSQKAHENNTPNTTKMHIWDLLRKDKTIWCNACFHGLVVTR
jgi:hypothetical protein